jgi:hypothetical protein
MNSLAYIVCNVFKNILNIGASGHDKVIIDIVEKQGNYDIFGLIDIFKNKRETIFNYEILEIIK